MYIYIHIYIYIIYIHIYIYRANQQPVTDEPLDESVMAGDQPERDIILYISMLLCLCYINMINNVGIYLV